MRESGTQPGGKLLLAFAEKGESMKWNDKPLAQMDDKHIQNCLQNQVRFQVAKEKFKDVFVYTRPMAWIKIFSDVLVQRGATTMKVLELIDQACVQAQSEHEPNFNRFYD